MGDDRCNAYKRGDAEGVGLCAARVGPSRTTLVQIGRLAVSTSISKTLAKAASPPLLIFNEQTSPHFNPGSSQSLNLSEIA